jgi:hypothetical protein
MTEIGYSVREGYFSFTPGFKRLGGLPEESAATRFSATIMAILKRVRSEEMAIS